MAPTKIDDVFYFMPDADLSPDLHGVWRVNDDGSELEQLCDDIVRSYSIIDDYIYYDTLTYLGDHDFAFDAIYRMKTDGSDKQKLASGSTYIRFFLNGYIFAIQYEENNLVVIDPEGNNHVVLDDASKLPFLTYPFIAEDRYYFTLKTDNGNSLYLLDFETCEFTFFARIK